MLIPPNISDPLNLMNPDTEQGEYESQLLSPTFASAAAARRNRQKAAGMHGKDQHRHRKRPRGGAGGANRHGTRYDALSFPECM